MRFEVGKRYGTVDVGLDAIKILRRTEKTITVTNGTAEWRMRIKKSDSGDEYCQDSSYRGKWAAMFTYKAEYVIDE